MKSTKIFLFVSTVIALLLSACASPATPQPTHESALESATLVIGSGRQGGVFFPYGAGLAKLLSTNLTGVTATSIETAGSVENMKLLQNEKIQIGFSTVDSAYDAVQGQGAYSENGKVPALALVVLYNSFMHIVVSEASGIKSIDDMKGKIVSVGDTGSSTEGAADRILNTAGLDPKTGITRQNLSVAEATAAMAAGKLDAFFWVGGLPSKAIQDMLTNGAKVRFLDISPLLKPLATQYGSVYQAATMPKDVYGLEADLPGIGIGNILFVNASMSEERAYQILTVIFAHLEDVHKFHAQGANLSLENAISGSPIPFHPGAIRFYTEHNVWNK